MHFLEQSGLFLLDTLIIVVAILLLIAGIIAITSRGKEKEKGKIRIAKLNKRYARMTHELQATLLDKKALKRFEKAQKKSKKDPSEKRLFVINFHGDIKASAVQQLREEITGILMVAKPEDEVLVKVETGGGMVHAYGLAASQLQRLRAHNIPLTVSLDKIGASGGYLMAAVANKILAAPFAIVGSIGVVAQMPNFHKFLKKHNIDYEQLTAGEYKRTLTLFGENTSKARSKFQEDLDEAHDLFKAFLEEHRPQLDMQVVATGEHWFGSKALELKLVDEIITSDDYLLQAHKDLDVFSIQCVGKKSLGEKLTGSTSALWQKVINAWQQSDLESRHYF